MSTVITRPKKKEFDPTREAGPDNPLPDQIYDKQSGAFKGYKPKVDRPNLISAGVRGESGITGGADGTPPPQRDWRDNRPKTLGGRVVEDVKETISDIKDEPEEVPHRIKERFKDYFIQRPKKK